MEKSRKKSVYYRRQFFSLTMSQRKYTAMRHGQHQGLALKWNDFVNRVFLCVFSEWKHSSSKNISVATCNGLQIALAVGKELFYIEIEGQSLNQIRFVI